MHIYKIKNGKKIIDGSTFVLKTVRIEMLQT